MSIEPKSWVSWGGVLKTFTVPKSQNGESRYIIAMISVQAIKNYHPAAVAVVYENTPPVPEVQPVGAALPLK